MIWISFESRNFINELMSSKKGDKKMLFTVNRSTNYGNSSTNLVIPNGAITYVHGIILGKHT